jgi:hypothetical protein
MFDWPIVVRNFPLAINNVAIFQPDQPILAAFQSATDIGEIPKC